MRRRLPETVGGPPSALRRELRLVDAIGIGLGAIIGAGIFVVTGVAAGVAGASFVVGLLIAGVAATCNGLSSAELAATYPQSGGTYEYGYRVLNPALGFAAGWMFLASKLAAGGAVALGFGAYFSKLVPGVPLRAAAVGTAVLLTAANLFGIKKAGRLNTAIVAVTLVTLLCFVVAGLPSFEARNLEPFAPRGWRGVAEAAALLFFAYTGYARIATLGEEVSEPSRTIPRAILITVALSVLLYLAVALVAVGAVGAEEMARTSSPLERAAREFQRPLVVRAVGVGATTAMLGVLLSQMVGISRMMFAMARRNDLPRVLEHVSSRHSVPDHGILVSGAVIVILIIVGTLHWVVAAASFTILLYYGITNIAALRLGAVHKLYPRWVAALGLVFCVVLALSLRPALIATGVAMLISGFLLRGLFRRSGPPPPIER